MMDSPMDLNFTDIFSCQDILTEQQCVSLFVVRTVFGIFGAAISVFFVFAMWVSNKLVKLCYRILLYISVGHATRATVSMLTVDGLPIGHPWCTIQGLLSQYFVWVLISWEFCLTVHIFLDYIKIEYTTENRERIYHLLCWGIPAVFTIIPLAANQYGPAVTWCWIKDPAWTIAVLYGEFAALILIHVCLYTIVICDVLKMKPSTPPRQPEEAREVEKYKKQIRSMILYPCAILLEGIVPIAFRTYLFINSDEDPPFVFVIVFAPLSLLGGLAFVLVYLVDPVTRGEILNIRVNCMKKMDELYKRNSQGEQRGETFDVKVISTADPISIEPTRPTQ